MDKAFGMQNDKWYGVAIIFTSIVPMPPKVCMRFVAKNQASLNKKKDLAVVWRHHYAAPAQRSWFLSLSLSLPSWTTCWRSRVTLMAVLSASLIACAKATILALTWSNPSVSPNRMLVMAWPKNTSWVSLAVVPILPKYSLNPWWVPWHCWHEKVGDPSCL